jgi:hypothetical protein
MKFVGGDGMNAIAERLERGKRGWQFRLGGRSSGRNESCGGGGCGGLQESATGERRIGCRHG